MAKLNIPLLKRLRTRFLRMRHPEHFDMEAFADKNQCGTSMCIAGHALVLEGYKVKFIRNEDRTEGPFYTARFFAPSGRRVKADKAAARVLGLNATEAYNLFYDFDLETPQQAAARIQRIIETGEV